MKAWSWRGVYWMELPTDTWGYIYYSMKVVFCSLPRSKGKCRVQLGNGEGMVGPMWGDKGKQTARVGILTKVWSCFAMDQWMLMVTLGEGCWGDEVPVGWIMKLEKTDLVAYYWWHQCHGCPIPWSNYALEAEPGNPKLWYSFYE